MILIVDCGTSWLSEICEHVPDHEVIDMNSLADIQFDRYQGIVISGAPTLLTESNIDLYKQRFSFIKNSSIPILGICLGHQIMGTLFGATISKGNCIDRMEPIEIVTDDPLFRDIENEALFREEHSEYISLPEDFLLLARSGSCGNEAMRHKNRLLYGVQFHPEVSGVAGGRLFANFLSYVEKHSSP